MQSFCTCIFFKNKDSEHFFSFTIYLGYTICHFFSISWVGQVWNWCLHLPWKKWVKPNLSPWLFGWCAVVGIAYRNPCFHFLPTINLQLRIYIQVSCYPQWFLDLSDVFMLIKQGSLLPPRNLVPVTFAIPSLLSWDEMLMRCVSGYEMSLLASDQAELFAKTFFKS